MKNVHLLPTDKPSRLYLFEERLILGDLVTVVFKKSGAVNQHIYITSDEEIKDGDYRYSLSQNTIELVTKFSSKVNGEYWKLNPHLYKKVILTTDQDLIKDGVQAIDDDFLKWFVENQSCEQVEVVDDWNSPRIDAYEYKIIIPKEEPKQFSMHAELYMNHCIVIPELPKQETLLEAAERIYDDNLFDYQKYRNGFIKGFIECAKRQQEQDQNVYLNGYIDGSRSQAKFMYNDEEVLKFTQTMIMLYKFGNTNIEQMDLLKETLEQFKNDKDYETTSICKQRV